MKIEKAKIIQKGYKFRLYPTKKQSEILDNHFRLSNKVYNMALETKETVYKDSNKTVSLSGFDLIKQFTQVKKEPYFKFFYDVDAASMNNAILDLETAYKNFFSGRAKYPNFKNKFSKKSFNLSSGIKVDFEKELFSFSKVKGIKIKLHRPIEGEIRQNATIYKTPTNKYYVSILVVTNQIIPNKVEVKEETTVGIDLGISHYLILSNGEKVENPKFYKNALAKLKFLDKKFSKYKGKRTKQKRAKAYEKVKQLREDFLHKLSSQLTNNYDTIGLETLNVKGMIKNHNLASSIQDAAWGEFVRLLEYKSEWKGKNVKKSSTFNPTSKTCSNCGEKNTELKLKDRVWTCKSCLTTHDRDINAAINIKNNALKG